MFAGTVFGTVFRSTNNGSSWSDMSSGLTGQSVYAMTRSGAFIFAGTTDSGVFRSTNNGLSWIPVNSGLTNRRIWSLVVKGESMFAGTSGGGVFRSTNNGDEWVAAGLPGYSVYDFVIRGEHLFAALPTRGIYHTSDNGTTWNRITDDSMDQNVQRLGIDDTFLYAGTYGSGVWRRPLSEIITNVGNEDHDRVVEFLLHQNYPNPFNPATTISYDLPVSGRVSLSLFDLYGRCVRTLVDATQEAGMHIVQLDGTDLASGVYVYRLRSGAGVSTRKCLLIR